MNKYAQLPRLLIVVAVVLFLLAGLGFSAHVGLLALGLAAWALADCIE